MSHALPPIHSLNLSERITEGALFWASKRPCHNVVCIDVLDDDSLIDIFRLYRPELLDEDETDDVRILRGGEWRRERWWYKPVHVCRRWRSLILGSASHLGLSLLCTYRTPVAVMLTHSPPLPLVIDYVDRTRNLTPEDEEGIKLALRHHDRVRRIRLAMYPLHLSKLINSNDKEFKALEYLYIVPLSYNDISTVFPERFRAPNLRHLVLVNFALPMGSTLLSTAAGLITFTLNYIPPSGSCHPIDFLHQVSSMSHLRTLRISFPLDHNITRSVMNTMNVMHVTLPNLRWLGLYGCSTYMGALLPCLRAPLFERLQIDFPIELPVSIPNLQQFISSAENLRFTSASLEFGPTLFSLQAYPYEGHRICALSISVYGMDHWLHLPLSSTTQILGVLGPVFSAVAHLAVGVSSQDNIPRYNEADAAHWRDILRVFNNVKTLRMEDTFIMDIYRALEVRDEESTMVLLPELKEIICTSVDGDNLFDTFAPFLFARQYAGHPVTLISR